MISTFKMYAILVLKGMGMGAANVIPGVSGGTIALITGIFERIINAIKSFDGKALNLLYKRRFKELIEHTDFYFLIAIFAGTVLSIITLARVFEFLFGNYPVLIWSYFFGLILASVYFVGKTVSKWTTSVVVTFLIGAAIAIFVSFMNPAAQNDSFLYLFICGIVAVCSMILPGLSGSFVLMLMGNYELVAIHAINDFNIQILFPVALGAIFGLIAFSHFLSWIFKKFKNQTISLLTGFILGSLSILWPWKNPVYKLDLLGNSILKNGKPIVQGYKFTLPDSINLELIFAIGLILLGVISIVLIEKFASEKVNK
jgi:putative membrane protein